MLSSHPFFKQQEAEANKTNDKPDKSIENPKKNDDSKDDLVQDVNVIGSHPYANQVKKDVLSSPKREKHKRKLSGLPVIPKKNRRSRKSSRAFDPPTNIRNSFDLPPRKPVPMTPNAKKETTILDNNNNNDDDDGFGDIDMSQYEIVGEDSDDDDENNDVQVEVIKEEQVQEEQGVVDVTEKKVVKSVLKKDYIEPVVIKKEIKKEVIIEKKKKEEIAVEKTTIDNDAVPVEDNDDVVVKDDVVVVEDDTIVVVEDGDVVVVEDDDEVIVVEEDEVVVVDENNGANDTNGENQKIKKVDQKIKKDENKRQKKKKYVPLNDKIKKLASRKTAGAPKKVGNAKFIPISQERPRNRSKKSRLNFDFLRMQEVKVGVRPSIRKIQQTKGRKNIKNIASMFSKPNQGDL